MSVRFVIGISLASALAVGTFAGCSSVEETGQDTAKITSPAPGGQALVRCYTDADGDGYGAGTGRNYESGCPAGTTTRGGDCDDANAFAMISRSDCYVDADHDGFGVGSKLASACAGVDACESTSSAHPTGYASKNGDCDDSDAARHPENLEVADGKDNDCSEPLTGETLSDEAYFVYPSSSSSTGEVDSANTNNSVVLDFVLLDSNQVNAAAAGSLYARASYAALENTANVLTTSYMKVTAYASGGRQYGTSTVKGLASPLSVYRIQLEFAKQVSRNGATTYSAMGAKSDAYVTMTRAATESSHERARFNTVMRALYEWNYSIKGGFLDGESPQERYDASAGAAWCTEFYASMGKPLYQYLGPVDEGASDSAAETNTTSLGNWFGAFGGKVVTSAVSSSTLPGDYVALNDDCDPTVAASHSEMFLAWDAAAGHYWWVAGNVNNRVALGDASTTANCDDGSTGARIQFRGALKDAPLDE